MSEVNTTIIPFSDSCLLRSIVAIIIILVFDPIAILTIVAWLIWIYVLIKMPNITAPAIQFLMKSRAILDVLLLGSTLICYEPFSEFNRFTCHKNDIGLLIEDYFSISVYATISKVRNFVIIILTATRFYFAKHPRWSLFHLTVKIYKFILIGLTIFSIIISPTIQCVLMFYGKHWTHNKTHTILTVLKVFSTMEMIMGIYWPIISLLFLLILIEIHVCHEKSDYDTDGSVSSEILDKKKRLLWMTRLEVLFFTCQYIYIGIQIYLLKAKIAKYWMARIAISTLMLTSSAYILVLLKFVKAYRDAFMKFLLGCFNLKKTNPDQSDSNVPS